MSQLNIDHFRRKIAVESDLQKLEMLCRLLAEEEAKLDETAGSSPPDDANAYWESGR